MTALAIIGLAAFALQFAMMLATSSVGAKKQPAIVTIMGLISEAAFVALGVVVLV